MRLSDQGQGLLERLWVAAEEDGQGAPLESTSLAGMDELLTHGLIDRDGERPRLTPGGHFEATRLVRRRRLAERLLADVLTADGLLLDERACRLGHALADGIDDSICTLLGHPVTCPHGKSIPRGECCRRMRTSVERLIVPLCELRAGQAGHIAHIQMSDAGHLQKLMAMGVLPGVPIALLHRFPSFVFQAGHSQFAVDESIAAQVYVRLSGQAAG